MFPANLKYLRKKHKLSQQQLADSLQIPRTTLGDYERGHTEPNIETLVRIASHFDVSMDLLLSETASHESLEVMRSEDLRILAISVDSQNRQNIELVPARAEAGYLQGFQDPDYIRELPKMYFPAIPEGTYRAFEIQGDSMVPMESGSVVICSYVENLSELKNEKTYVIATHLDGIVYKRIVKNPDGESLTAISDNPVFPPYKVLFRDIAEIWQYYAHISFTDTKTAAVNAIDEKIHNIEKDVQFIKQQLSS